ncbi:MULTISPECIES: hypothetical protein [Pandoraea]|uniref:hypothetical protein n=1 Tax=Pandoraea TaxID=93217 RepID=UPI001F5C71D5|nr:MULTISPECIES: hypothetical protein [Pandoraea]
MPVRSGAPTVWPAALALMLVANLVVPAASFVPKIAPRCRNGDDSERQDSGCVGLHAQPPVARNDDADVIAQPIAPQMTIKHEYSSQDVLRSIGAGSEPFKNLGNSVVDMYALLTGHDVSQQTREQIQQRTHMMDVATGLLPEVAILRLPSEVTDVVADSRDGKPISTDRIVSILQNADPRVMTRPLGNAMRPARRGAKGGKIHAMPETPPGGSSGHAVQAPRKTLDAVDRKMASGGREVVIEHAGIDDEARVAAGASAIMTDDAAAMAIIGERTYLQGYEQQITDDKLPASGAARIVLVDGRHYLRGEAGYYRTTRGSSGDHWLVDSAQRTLAQVPVTYDPQTGRWEAHAPLRLCGGGCGNSRVTTPDSIALNRHEVDAVLSHLRDDDVQNAILGAYAEVSRMKLMRTNRPDLRPYRDYSILKNRDAIRVALEQVPPDASLFEQQRLAAFVTTSHYRLNPGTEAFCQENAEILFHFLIEGGVHGDCVRMITVQPKHRSPHALVLYTESVELIDALELATPIDFEGPGTDGITGTNFAGLIMGAQDTTVLLDPWSRVKAVGFAMTKDPMETRRVLDAAFADIGHRQGEPYTVSLTRPLGPRRSSLSSRGSMGSMSSGGSLSRTSSSRGSSGGSAKKSNRGSTSDSTLGTSSESGASGSAGGSSSGYGASNSLESVNPAGLPSADSNEIADGA